ncbi:hypothetical protein [Phenylobacterium sp.]|uniref:hypothetical protein n=1 Tax=Phenylobacterium sp. TaxID=1871053 RepID=UPI0025D01E2D|nr:hypothetical protein [Phenylobacterium sp.]MBX3482513.1 hypothetical protein [Phenylobacterium sp.]MCW5758260.1 hypothetical protein [Phenylobacterium sp.]
MADFGLDATELDIPCPQCGHETARSIGRLKREHGLDCGGCGRHIDTDAEELEHQVRAAVQRGADLLAQQLKRLR